MTGPVPPDARIVVAGAGASGPVAEDPRSIPELVLDAVQRALADAGTDHDGIDAVVTSSVDLFDGLTASNVAVTEVVGAVLKPETRIAGDGLCAALQAVCQLRAGAYETVLVVAHGKASMAPGAALTEWAVDPILQQPLGVDFDLCAGLQASALAAGDPEAVARWAWRAAERRADAAPGGVAGPVSAESVLDSPRVAHPLREEMRAPAADGAFAVVLQRVPAGDGRPAIVGVGHDLDTADFGQRDLLRWAGLERALARGCAVAGLDPAAAPFDVLEPTCRWPHEEELFAAAVGAGSAAVLSPTGGLFAGAVPAAGGLSRLVAATAALRGLDRPGRALVHGAWGPAGQGQVVAILEGSA